MAETEEKLEPKKEDEKEKVKFSEDDVVAYCVEEIRSIREANATLNTDRTESLRFYRGDPEIVEVVEQRSKATTTDMQDLVEWAKPSLLDIFGSSEDVFSLEPRTQDDTEPVENLELLVSHQLKVKNNWFLVLHDWFDDMLKLKTGAVKYQWLETKEGFEKEYEDLTQDEYEAKLREPGTKVLAHKEIKTPIKTVDPQNPQVMMNSEVVTHDLTLKYVVEDEYPLIEACPAEDVGFHPRTRDIKDTFVYHKTRLKEWAFKKKYGRAVFKKVKDLREDLKDDTDAVTKARYEDLGGADFFYDKKKSEWVVYECYFRDEEDGEPKLVEICGEVKCKAGKNKYGKPPFHVITPIRMAHRVSGYSFYDLVKEIQRIRTAFLRQIMDNLYFANNRRYFGDAQRINMNDYLGNNFPGAFIRTVGDPSTVVRAEEKAPLPPEVFTFWEMIATEKDYHTGLPRSFQGVNPAVLNKTFRGQAQQVNQAAARMQMMARLIAELGISPLVTDIVDLNIRFLKKKTAVRYLNTFVDIGPDNIVGKYDTVVSVGLGFGNKDQTIQYMQQLLALYAQASKMGATFVTPDNMYYALKQLVKAMGYRDTQNYVTDPKGGEALFQLVMMAIQSGLVKNPQVGPLIGQVVQAFGLGPKIQKMMAQTAKPQGGPPTGQPGADVSQAPSLPPMQAAQPSNPSMLPSGGGLFA